MKRIPNLNWLLTFETAARHLNFTAAGKELGMTQTAVSQHIKALETKLGYILFKRLPKSLELTEMGRAYLPGVERALENLALTTDGLFGPAVKETLIVRAPISTAALWLAPNLRSFQKNYPDIGVRIVTTIWANHITPENIDVEIQLTPSNQIASGEKLSDEFLVPICLKGTEQKFKTVSELMSVPTISILGFEEHWAKYMQASGIAYERKHPEMSADTSIAAFEMVAAGMGNAIVVERFAKTAIQAGRSIEIAGPGVPAEQSHYLMPVNSEKKRNQNAEVFKNWLRDIFAKE